MEDNASKNKTRKLTSLFKLPLHYAAFKLYIKRGNLSGAYRNLKKLAPVYKRSPAYQNRLSKLAFRQKLWKQSLDHINAVINLTDENTALKLYKRKAECLIKLGESAKAISCLDAYLQVNPNDSHAWFMQANEYTRLQQWEGAANSFEAYLRLQPEDSIVSYQLGECYFKLNKTRHAEAHFEQTTKNCDSKCVGQSLAFAYYMLGLMQLMNNKPQSATSSFNKAVKQDQKLKSKRFGIGVFHEHFKQWKYALEAYKDRLSQNDRDAELQFKIASMLDGINQPGQALSYYENALKLDKVRSPWNFALANCYDQLKDYENAAKWYKNAIARQEKHRPGNYRRLGHALSQLGEMKGALEAYKEAELFSCPSTIDEGFYKKNITKARVRYAISYEHYSIDNKMIFYESLDGARIMGNPYAIFKYIYNHIDFNEYTHVWVIRSFDVIPDELRAKDNIIFVKKGSDAYFRYISSAKYLICNNIFSDYIVRKPDQFYLQTSHGIFYKTVGRDSSGTPLGVAGGTRNLLQATHIIVPNEYMAEKQPKSYSIKGISSGQIAKIGYPRIDITINASDDVKHQIMSKLKLEPSKKTVFYAPTWRGSSKTSNWFDSAKLVADLKMLAELDVNLIFRSHTESDHLLKNVKLPDNIIVPPPDIQTNELLSIADILITDYSSVFFDFIVTERPIIHYLHDVEEYARERGLNLTEDELPGSVVKTGDQLVASVVDNLNNDSPSSRYLAAKKRFCPYDDGRSTERIVRWFFLEDDRDINFVHEEKLAKSWLCLGGMLSEKSSIESLVSKLNELVQDGNVVSIMLNKGLERDKDKLRMLNELKSNINLIIHAGVMPTTLEEASAIEYFNLNGKFINKKMELVYKYSFNREVRRLFGDSQFDEVVNYETDSNYWNALRDSIQR